ncbi:ABC transporter permease [Xylanibacter ruminicola]|uniref:ABC transporter, permease protein n=2 Tax=Xylanibacter ruminicola TaxID=839 RepID=D5ESL1_XYLR2|nr:MULTISPECIES: ABC transporter permease [Prevotellaceae]MBO4895831.1 ABC transporter permease [Prevotella sp.]ADE83184.1 putative ABC transporter, permease protein [Xylanibacter ruminicola 23]MBQ6055197.1 ABC transporter permease [Prevotella sp.]MDO4984730.1 ABC transporter permease [Prevotella sp.]QVJ80808.1 ABC transporter permease [Xylanibacter ruminicola]
MNFPLYIAKRIYSDQGDKRKVSRPAIRIATIGVAIGLAVMIVTVSVVLGFKHTIRDKVVGFGSHIQVHNIMNYNGSDPHPICANDSLMKAVGKLPGVAKAERFSMTQGILKTDEDFLGIAIKGIAEEYDTTFLSQHLIAGNITSFSDKTSKYKLLVSKMIADKMRLKVGDKVFGYFIDNQDVRTRKFTISGIYQTNMTRFDETLCFTDLHTANKLNGWTDNQATGIEVLVKDFEKVNETANQFIDNINRTSDEQGNSLTSETIYELYPQVFSWLELLDINVWIILALMVCVAGFTMISGLLIIILERTQMIGILKALGARNKTVRHTFLWFSVFIIGQGLFWGNIVGIGIVLLQKYTGFITLDPQTYYVSEAPMELNLPLVALINIATLLICVFVLIAPSYLISHIHPAKSMRYE